MWRKHWLLARAPIKQQAEYRLSCHNPDSIIACSWGRNQWRLRHGFSRTEPPPRRANCWIWSKRNSVAELSVSTLFCWDWVRDGSPSGNSSERSGFGAGRPSSKTRGISLARLFVLQSMAAQMKSTDWSWSARDLCRSGWLRSWDGSSNQSTGRHRQPHQRNAFDKGAVGPDIRSAISGAVWLPTPESAPPSSGPHQESLGCTLHVAGAPKLHKLALSSQPTHTYADLEGMETYSYTVHVERLGRA